jgi:hypothetical protein
MTWCQNYSVREDLQFRIKTLDQICETSDLEPVEFLVKLAKNPPV